jgi:threonyl-tRNA synthetase
MDVENFELRILRTFDFQKYAPEFFLIEDNDCGNNDFMDYKNTEIYSLLRSNGYSVVAKTKRTVFYRKPLISQAS